MTADLHDRLGLLADRAPKPRLDLPRTRAEARRRLRRRRLAVAGPAAVVLVAVPLALAAAGLGGDRLVLQPADQAPQVPLVGLQAAVTAEVVDGDSPPRLSAVAAADPVLLGSGPTSVTITFESLTTSTESFWPFPYWEAQANVNGPSSGILGVGGACAPGWEGTGQHRVQERCAGALVVSQAEPGRPQPAALVLYPRVGDQQARPGTYRAFLDLRDGATLVVTVTVAERLPSLPSPPSGTGPAGTGPAGTGPDGAATGTETPPAGTAGQDGRTVQIFLSTAAVNCGDVRAVERQVPHTEAVATAALQELFGGRISDEERAAGLVGFAPEAAGLLRRLRIADGTAYVDLNASHRSAIDYAGTSCGSAAFQTVIASTLRQFPTVRDVRYAFDGDPRAFVEFSQGACPEGAVPPGDPCDPRPWNPAYR